MTTALIIGSAGQDGRIMTERLLGEGLRVVGLDRGLATDSAAGPLTPVDLLDLYLRANHVADDESGELQKLARHLIGGESPLI